GREFDGLAGARARVERVLNGGGVGGRGLEVVGELPARRGGEIGGHRLAGAGQRRLGDAAGVAEPRVVPRGLVGDGLGRSAHDRVPAVGAGQVRIRGVRRRLGRGQLRTRGLVRVRARTGVVVLVVAAGRPCRATDTEVRVGRVDLRGQVRVAHNKLRRGTGEGLPGAAEVDGVRGERAADGVTGEQDAVRVGGV